MLDPIASHWSFHDTQWPLLWKHIPIWLAIVFYFEVIGSVGTSLPRIFCETSACSMIQRYTNHSFTAHIFDGIFFSPNVCYCRKTLYSWIKKKIMLFSSYQMTEERNSNLCLFSFYKDDMLTRSRPVHIAWCAIQITMQPKLHARICL